MKRREWTFEKPAVELRAAAADRCEYHMKRMQWWENAREEADSAIQEHGIEIRTHPQTGGDRHEAVLDPGLVKRLGECEQKIDWHRVKSDEYAQWVNALDSAGDRSLVLDYEDWIFFFGLHGDDDE